ncbi:MAG: hypothetical protein ABR577_05390 [Pyrinomonadaceae bacterium]
MKRRILLLLICLLCLALPVIAQKNLSGSWEWKSRADKNRMQTYFSINIKPKGKTISGTLFFTELENGNTESDGAITPFTGTLNGETLSIEFDPKDLNPGYTENLRYKKPKNKSPSTAILKLKNGKLEWTQTKGTLGEGMPKLFTLRRAK